MYRLLAIGKQVEGVLLHFVNPLLNLFVRSTAALVYVNHLIYHILHISFLLTCTVLLVICIGNITEDLGQLQIQAFTVIDGLEHIADGMNQFVLLLNGGSGFGLRYKSLKLFAQLGRETGSLAINIERGLIVFRYMLGISQHGTEHFVHTAFGILHRTKVDEFGIAIVGSIPESLYAQVGNTQRQGPVCHINQNAVIVISFLECIRYTLIRARCIAHKLVTNVTSFGKVVRILFLNFFCLQVRKLCLHIVSIVVSIDKACIVVGCVTAGTTPRELCITVDAHLVDTILQASHSLTQVHSS